MNKITTKLLLCALAVCLAAATARAQVSASDSVYQHVKGNRLSIGGYGEIAYSRNFYSDNPFRYSNPSYYKNDPSHGRFDIPHAVLYVGYDFGKGWSVGMEIEFEHGGSGGAIEKEAEEGGEWEAETEKGGEVELEQFWVQKSFADWANIRFGHIVLPFGLTNAHHEPLNFFTVYRPEGERTIIPSTWHQTGISFWGRAGDFRYELQFTGGLDAFQFDRTYWIGKGAQSPYEFEVANKFGLLARVDNYTIPGLRIGVSGYYGKTMHNTFPHDLETDGNRYKDIKGNIYLGSIDFTYNAHNWIARGYADYGYVSDAQAISAVALPQDGVRLACRCGERRGRLRRVLAVQQAAPHWAETLRFRPLRVLRLIRQQHDQQIYAEEHRCGGRQLLPHTAGCRQGGIQPPFLEEPVQRRAGTEHRRGLRGLFPLIEQVLNHK